MYDGSTNSEKNEPNQGISESASFTEREKDKNVAVGNKGTSKDTRQNADPPVKPWRIRETIETFWNFAKKPESTNVAMALATIVIAVATGFTWREIHSGSADTKALAEAAGKQAIAAGKQADRTKDLADRMIVQQRPWVQIDPSIGGPFVGDDKGIHLTLNLTVRNSGLIPALGVEYKPVLYPTFQANPAPLNRRLTLCTEVVTRRGSPLILFAGTPMVENRRELEVPREDVNLHLTVEGRIPADVIICVAYRSFVSAEMTLNSTETYFTGYIYHLVSDQGDLKFPGTIPQAKLRLEGGAVLGR